ncbi:MAG: universal stress protein [Cyclobacteriaceae bacterium]|nr:universal stress protein [Cyclobacteriaceae bacterium]
MKKILCPTDFSETANNAIAYAAKLCQKLSAELTLFNVQSVFSLPPDEVIKGSYLATELVREKLDSLSYQVMEVYKISCTYEVEASNQNMETLIANRGIGYDLILMGTNGADDYYQFFFGSRSYEVAKKSSVPVLLVPTRYLYQDIALSAYAFDYEGELEVPMIQMTDWITITKSKVIVVQIKDHYTREAELSSKQVVERTKLRNNSIDLLFDTVYSDDVGQAIHDYVTNSKVDVLALCSIHHSFITTLFQKSVINKLTATADYPILVFHK